MRGAWKIALQYRLGKLKSIGLPLERPGPRYQVPITMEGDTKIHASNQRFLKWRLCILFLVIGTVFNFCFLDFQLHNLTFLNKYAARSIILARNQLFSRNKSRNQLISRNKSRTYQENTPNNVNVYKPYETSNKSPWKWKERMKRKADCPRNSSKGIQSLLKKPHTLDHLLVDDYHKIIFCYVPKVACTNWKKVMVSTVFSALAI